MYDHFLKYLRFNCEMGKLTLDEIGTSEEELRNILMRGLTKDAKEFLESLRRGSYLYEKCIGYLRETLANGNLTLEALGSSEEELEKLRVKGCRLAALLHLGNLRSHSLRRNRRDEIRMREELRKGGLTLADIGMNEEQVAALLKASQR